METQCEGCDQPTFRFSPFLELPPLLESLGHDPAKLFREVGVDLQVFSDPDRRMPMAQASGLLAHCIEATGRPELGHLLGRRVSASHLGLVGFMIKSSSTVEMALRALVEYIDLQDDGSTLFLDVDGEFTTLTYAMQVSELQAVAAAYDFCITVCYEMLRALCGPDWRPASVHLEHAPPANRAVYERYFGCPVYFDDTDCRLVFASACLAREPSTADRMLFDYLSREAKAVHLLRRGDLREALPRTLRHGLLVDRFSAHDVADEFGLHERTLHRRLHAAGTSFRRELDRVRRTVAEQLLEATDLPISEVADALGYAGSSGFIRAFERWTGASPANWRRCQRESGSVR